MYGKCNNVGERINMHNSKINSVYGNCNACLKKNAPMCLVYAIRRVVRVNLIDGCLSPSFSLFVCLFV